ncbi:unnamed protein product [Ranitomeya imitator]|uniref:Set2 Rpb1 interacting domain-containing protein n=1 Tax=Ranitomeya imitator TaxID=111125 RepID=A0ABN9MAE0_9NEOB|nr:unnamed protein product [Ranitomeya imitator]
MRSTAAGKAERYVTAVPLLSGGAHSQCRKQSAGTDSEDVTVHRSAMSEPYRKPDCKIGEELNTTRTSSTCARKLTHGVMNKELKYCKNPEDLDCNENVKHKTKEYIKKYMQKFGTIYKPKEDVDFE